MAAPHPDSARECFFLTGDHLGLQGLPAPLYPCPCPFVWHACFFLHLTEQCCPRPCLMSLATLLHALLWPQHVHMGLGPFRGGMEGAQEAGMCI